YWTAFSGGPGAWDKANELAVVLPANHGYDAWTPTVKLKALRRAQQDMELLNMLAARPGWDRWRVARAVASILDLSAKNEGRNAEDPRATVYARVHAPDMVALRRAVIDELLRK